MYCQSPRLHVFTQDLLQIINYEISSYLLGFFRLFPLLPDTNTPSITPISLFLLAEGPRFYPQLKQHEITVLYIPVLRSYLGNGALKISKPWQEYFTGTSLFRISLWIQLWVLLYSDIWILARWNFFKTTPMRFIIFFSTWLICDKSVTAQNLAFLSYW